MAGIYIFLSVFTALLFILTRDSLLRVTHRGEWVIEIHFTFFALRFGGSDKASSSQKGQGGRNKHKLPLEFYRRLVVRFKHILTVSEVCVRRLAFSEGDSEFADLRYARFKWAAGTALAYLATEARSLTVAKDALGFISDNKAFEFDITARLKVYSLLRFAIAVLYDLIKLKHLKRKRKYVGK